MVVRALQERGLVTAPITASTGRSLPAGLTREGVELLNRTDAGCGKRNAMTSKLSEEDRRDFRRLLAAVLDR